MKKNILLIISAFALLTSCEKKSKSDNVVEGDSSKIVQIENSPVTNHSCYLGILSKDTVSLSVEIKNDSVTGKLDYLRFEKDSNHGSIKGKFVGDTLIAVYNFRAEGMDSEREVVFLKSGNDLIEGYGEYNEKTYSFKNRKDLKFEKNLILKSIDCK